MQRRFSATVEIRTKKSRIIYSALKPDINPSIERHANVDMKLVGDTILIDIKSEELSDLRARLNSYLRLARTCISCLDVTL